MCMGVDLKVSTEFPPPPNSAIISPLLPFCVCMGVDLEVSIESPTHPQLLLFCVRVSADLEVGHGEQGQQCEGHEVQQGRLCRAEHFRRHRRCQETCTKEQSVAVRNTAPFPMTAELNFYAQTSSFCQLIHPALRHI